MLVCHCACVSDREIRSAVREGAHTLDEIAASCGAGGCCGGCRGAVQEILAAELSGRASVTRLRSDESRLNPVVVLPVIRVAS